VIIDNLDLESVSVLPPEADPPLVVDSDAVLTRTIASQGFQPVPWYRSKVPQ
jgi:hypothetical protein